MNYLSIDYLIFYAFLGITALVGGWISTVRSTYEYIHTNRSLGTGALVMTLVATFLGGGMMFTYPTNIYTHGLSPIFTRIVLGIFCNLLITIFFIAPRIVHFKECHTMGDLIHLFFGEKGRLLIGLLSSYFFVIACSIHINYLHHAAKIMGLSSYSLLGVATLTIAFYTIKGGMRSVMITDALHCIFIFAVIPVMAHKLLHQAGGLRAVLSTLNSEQLIWFDTSADSRNPTSLSGFVMRLFPSFTLTYPFVQRLLAAKHQRQSTNMYYGMVTILVSFAIVMTSFGLAGIVLYPERQERFLLATIINSLPPGARGLLWVSLLGVILSSIDSFMHVAGIGYTQDIIKPLAKRWGVGVNEIRTIKYSTMFIAVLSFFLCLFATDLVKNISYLWDITSMMWVFPLICGIMGLKTHFRELLISMGLTATNYFFALFVLKSDDLAFTGSLVINILSFLSVHYYYNSGFVTVKRSVYGQTTSVWHPSWEGTKTSLVDLIPTPQKLLHYFQKKIEDNSARTTTLALFVAVSYMGPFFMNAIGKPDAYYWLLTLRTIGAVFCVGLLLQSQWPAGLLSYFPTFYHMTLLWCFPIMTTFLFLLEGSSTEWVANVMLSIILFILLLDYATAFLLSAIGIALAMGLYRLGIGPLDLSLDTNIQYMLFYGICFSIAIGLLFSRVREKRVRRNNRHLKDQEVAHQATLLEVAAEKQTVLNILDRAGADGLLSIAQKLNTISTAIEANAQLQDSHTEPSSITTQLQTLQAELLPMAAQVQDLQKELLPLVIQLKDINARGQDYLRLHVQKDLPIEQFLLTLQEKLLPRGIDVPLLIERKTQHQHITADAEQLVALLVKGIASLQWLLQDDDQYLLLALEDTHLGYPVPDVAEDYVKYVPALRITLTTTEQLPPINANYTADLTDSIRKELETFQEMEQRKDERIIKAHYGYAEVSEDTLAYVIPVDLSKVRPQDMDKPYMDLNAIPEHSNDHFKSDTVDAQAQEKAFLAEVATQSKVNLGLVKMAISLIKWYHGPKKRHSGEPFYLHPLAVAQIVLDYSTDEAVVLGALLHDTIEDTQMLSRHIGQLFGQETQEIVDIVTHLQSVEGSSYKIRLSAEENLKMLERPGNERGLYVKLADRMHNMRTIEGHPKLEKRQAIAKETMDFFVPLAERLGLQEAAQELRKRCQQVGIRTIG